MAIPSPTGKKKSKKYAQLPTVAAAADSLPWHLAFSAKAGRHAVADKDLPAGTLVLVERPLVAIPRSKLAGHVCHSCFRPLEKMVEKADQGFNPCLPRYCAPCKKAEAHNEVQALDSKLASLRIKLADIAKEHTVEPELLHFLVLLDVKRSTAAAAAADGAEAGAAGTVGAPRSEGEPPVLTCAAADSDALPSPWEKKAEGWRRAVTAALRPLHKALVGLEEGGTIPGYHAARLEQLQSDAALLVCSLQGVSAEGATTDGGVGLFPAGSSLTHSCRPNCHALTAGQTLLVRTIVDVPAGTALTVCRAQQYEPRAVRQAALMQERGLKCACERCTEPLVTSTDRFLEGVWCLNCTTDVLVAVPPATPEAAAAAAKYEEQLAELEAEEAALARRRKAGKKSPQKNRQLPRGQGSRNSDSIAANGTADDAGSAEQTTEPEATAAGTADAAEDSEEQQQAGADGGSGATAAPTDGAQGEEGAQEEAGEEGGKKPELRYWRCVACGYVEPAHNTIGTAPGDVLLQADKLWQQGAMLYQTRVPQLQPQAEAHLAALQAGVDGRLHPYHSRVIDSLPPLINLALRRGDALSVFNHSVLLWEAENAVQGRFSLHQLQYLSAIIDSSAAKATQAQSAVVKRQFEKKVKLAKATAQEIRRVLLGAA